MVAFWTPDEAPLAVPIRSLAVVALVARDVLTPGPSCPAEAIVLQRALLPVLPVHAADTTGRNERTKRRLDGVDAVSSVETDGAGS